jgi:two-component system nitrogen regulation response regulator GlnG
VLEALLEGEIFARSGGTLFLDEIGEMQIATQARFLRMLRVWEMWCPGWRKGEKPDIRVIAATKHDLRSLVAEGRFLEDLCRRLTRVEIRMPRLADRLQDFSLLQTHFIAGFAALHGKRVTGLTRAAHFQLAGYPWPGNVRELENVLRYAVSVCQGGRIDVQDLPPHLRTHTEKAA